MYCLMWYTFIAFTIHSLHSLMHYIFIACYNHVSHSSNMCTFKYCNKASMGHISSITCMIVSTVCAELNYNDDFISLFKSPFMHEYRSMEKIKKM